MVLGPAEAFTAEQYLELYDVSLVGPQRVNRAALPHLRRQGSGLLLWIGSSSSRGGAPPALAPYFAAFPLTRIELPSTTTSTGRSDDLDATLVATFPEGHPVTEVADEIVRIMDLRQRHHPFRVTIDASRDGSAVVSAIADRIHGEFYRRVGIDHLLPAHSNGLARWRRLGG